MYLPKTRSVIKDDLLIVNLRNKGIIAKPSIVKVNKQSEVKVYGNIKNYLSTPVIQFFATGNFAATDLGAFMGTSVTPYLEIKGALPFRAEFISKRNNMKVVAQLKADKSNYITPVNIDDLYNQQTLVQFLAEKEIIL